MLSFVKYPFFALFIALFAACDEGEHDYFYCVSNNTNHNVALAYQVVGTSKTVYDTLSPGQTDTLACRLGVSGENVWNVETSSEIYMISSLEASINDSVFTENARLRSLWGNVVKVNDVGVYTLNLSSSLFNVAKRSYFYKIVNRSGYSLGIDITSGGNPFSYQLPNADSLVFGPYYSNQKYMSNVYSSTSTRISAFSFKNFIAFSGADTLYTNNYNPAKVDAWTYTPTVIGADSVGFYTLSVPSSAF